MTWLLQQMHFLNTIQGIVCKLFHLAKMPTHALISSEPGLEGKQYNLV